MIAGADKSTISQIVRQVTLAIARQLDDFVKFPIQFNLLIFHPKYIQYI
jgi:hypothetical protein